MGEQDWVQCPGCGWTGRATELTGGGEYCPSCDAGVAD